MTPDEERLQRYLEWQRSRDAGRAQRRRRMVGYAVVPAVCVLALGFGMWLARPWLDRARPVTAITTPQSLPRTVESAPMPPERRGSPIPVPETQAPTPQQPAVGASELPARTRPRPAPPVAARARIRPAPRPEPIPAPPPANEAATETEVAAAVAPAPIPSPARPGLEPPREIPPEPLPAPSDVVAMPSQPDDALPAPAEPGPPTAGGAVAVGTPTVRERVTRWAKDEVHEFRDGVKRELRAFRSGYEKVRDFFRR